VKSNAIASRRDRTLALGGGQTSRVEPGPERRARAERLGISLTARSSGATPSFPSPTASRGDCRGATAIIQPGGSTRDAEVISAADTHGVAMVFTASPLRH